MLHWLCPNLPKIIASAQRIILDNTTPFRYSDDYSLRLMEASICWAVLSRRLVPS